MQMNIAKSLFLFILLLVLRSDVKAQSTFLKTYGSNQSEYGTSLCVTHDGGFVVASILPDGGNEIRVVLFKTDNNGNQQWVRSYLSTEKNVPTRVIPASDGGYYLLMSSFTGINPPDLYPVLLKTDSVGNELWRKSVVHTQSDNAIDLEVEGDHIYIICTSNYNTGGYGGILVHKMDTAGNWLWSQHYTSPYSSYPVSAALDGHGRLGILGRTNGYGIGTPINDNNLLLLIDSAGNQLSATVTGVFYGDEGQSLAWQNGTWVFSSLGYSLTSEYDISIQRFDSTGNFIESRLYDGTTGLYSWEVARDILPLPDGSLIITGDIGQFDERNVMLAKINPLGGVDWGVQYPVSPLFTNYAFQVVRSSDGAYAFTGDMRPPASFRNAYILKADSVGQIPCHTAPINFVISQDSLEVTYVMLSATEIFPTVSVPTLTVDVPFYAPYTECENIPPAAYFTSVLDTICPQTCYQFQEASTNPIDSWEWTFAGGEPAAYSGQSPPVVCYPNPGTYTVRLEVTNPDGASFYNSSIIVSKVKCDTLFIPNVITPNGDGKNDFFKILGLPERFQLQVYNRWGNLIYETDRKDKLWDPRDSTQGVYYYLLKLYESESSESHRGTVSVLGE